MLSHDRWLGGSYMSPFWNHILGFIYVEIAKIAATWKLAKLAKKNVSRFWGFEPGTNMAFYTKQGSDTYEFICTHSRDTVDMNSYF